MGWQDRLKAELNDSLGNDLTNIVGTRVEEIVGGWIGGKNDSIADVLVDALNDDRFDARDLGRLLAAVVKAYGKGIFKNDLVEELRGRLEQDGTLTTQDLMDVSGIWAASRTDDPILRGLILDASSGGLDEDALEDALVDYVDRQAGRTVRDVLKVALGELELKEAILKYAERQGANANEVRGIKAALTGGGELERALMQAAVSFLVLGDLRIDPVKSPEEYAEAIAGEYLNRQAPDLLEFIRAAIDGDMVAMTKVLLNQLGVMFDDVIIRAALEGNVSAIVEDYAFKWLKKEAAGISDAEVRGLFGFIKDVWAGRVSLGVLDEEEQLDIGPMMYGYFVRYRKVLYAVKRAVEGGPVVPVAAAARPHVFAAAEIGYFTPYSKIVKKNEDHKKFVVYVRQFIRVEFGEMQRSVINLGTLEADDRVRRTVANIFGELNPPPS
ncbi:MAG: hypothetical protein IH945_12695 [Armatimonadetes bacterium]|nr:hypothetical protein [Armatimonadota bacterium]